ncbi:MAG: hypothetical protein ACPL0A_02180, partial [Candidatus Micrarchaeia archaeon]
RYIYNTSINQRIAGGNAAFSYPSDIFIEDGLIYVSDMENDRIQVFNKSDYTFVSYYGLGRGGAVLTQPKHVAVDSDYVYVVESKEKSVKVLFKRDGRIVREINSSVYGFKDISGIFSDGSKLYVVDSGLMMLVVFDINKTSLLDYDDVYPLFEKMNMSINNLCETYSVAYLAGMTQQDKCNYYKGIVNQSYSYILNKSYDQAYSLITGKMPSIEGDISYLQPRVLDFLYGMHSNYSKRINMLYPQLSGELKTSARQIRSDLAKANSSISAGRYAEAYITLKEIGVRISALEDAMGGEEQVESMLKERYIKELNNLREEYQIIEKDLYKYGMNDTALNITSLFDDAGDLLESGDIDEAYEVILHLSKSISEAGDDVSSRKKYS